MTTKQNPNELRVELKKIIKIPIFGVLLTNKKRLWRMPINYLRGNCPYFEYLSVTETVMKWNCVYLFPSLKTK